MADLVVVTHDPTLMGDGLPVSPLGVERQPKFFTTETLSRTIGDNHIIYKTALSPNPSEIGMGDVVADLAGTLAYVANLFPDRVNVCVYLASQLEWKSFIAGSPKDNPKMFDYIGDNNNLTMFSGDSLYQGLQKAKDLYDAKVAQLAGL
ncbi:hypothetical protein AGMMS49543_20710 [Betaproteobacteria bacterium]|nr:hypothetical protein AGMMS49543_20710 [Betaproteobacteria bacterium]